MFKDNEKTSSFRDRIDYHETGCLVVHGIKSKNDPHKSQPIRILLQPKFINLLESDSYLGFTRLMNIPGGNIEYDCKAINYFH